MQAEAFSVAERPGRGRCAVASRPLGEKVVVLRERLAVGAPLSLSIDSPCCPHCLAPKVRSTPKAAGTCGAHATVVGQSSVACPACGDEELAFCSQA